MSEGILIGLQILTVVGIAATGFTLARGIKNMKATFEDVVAEFKAFRQDVTNYIQREDEAQETLRAALEAAGKPDPSYDEFFSEIQSARSEFATIPTSVDADGNAEGAVVGPAETEISAGDVVETDDSGAEDVAVTPDVASTDGTVANDEVRDAGQQIRDAAAEAAESAVVPAEEIPNSGLTNSGQGVANGQSQGEAASKATDDGSGDEQNV